MSEEMKIKDDVGGERRPNDLGVGGNGRPLTSLVIIITLYSQGDVYFPTLIIWKVFLHLSGKYK